MIYLTLAINVLLHSSFAYGSSGRYLSFPDGFSIGAASASYQIEGAWNINDKGESIWDRLTHTKPNSIIDRSNGDVASDSYHKYKEDVQLLKKIGVNSYRFSISWSRLLPTGYANVVSKDGLNYYNNLIDELLKHHIKPMVTIYHWDHPQVFEDLGGWTNETMIDWFSDFARVVFREFGDRVKIFSTMNEPWSFCNIFEGSNRSREYLCNYIVLKAHARAYHIYNKEFRSQQSGKIGIVLNTPYYYNKYENDKESANIAFQFSFGMYANPIFSKEGDWPAVVKKRIAENSKFEGLPQSRLPSFSREWIKYIKGTSDYLGLNYYQSKLAEPSPKSNHTIYENDHGLTFSFDEKWPASVTGLHRIVPEGFFALLIKIKNEYNNPLTYIMENGIPDAGTLVDDQRLEYLHSHMEAMLIAVNQYGCKIPVYTIWSLLDDFEWFKGYTQKYGLVHVDFNSPNRTRTLKSSSFWLKNVIRFRKLLPIEQFYSNKLDSSVF